MRINEEYKESGDFWLPSVTDEKSVYEKSVYGTLLISDGGNSELEVAIGELKDSSGKFNIDLKRIVGYVQKDRTIPPIPVTLDDCYYKLKNDMHLEIVWSHSSNHTIYKEAGIRLKRYFRLVSTQPHELDEFISVA